jgi:thioredoxin 1
MAYTPNFAETAPSREEIDVRQGPLLLEFGAPWCGYCQAAQPLIAEVLADHPDLPHLKIEDGPGRRLGRTFKVKLWPTLILVRQGEELGRVVRPDSEELRLCLLLVRKP